jgi:hypothetical protein
VRRRWSRVASSEAETRSGVRIPRARRRVARGGVKPSSEAETRLRGVKLSSEAEAPWRGAWSSSETEARPRGTATDCLVGCCGFLGRGPSFALGRNHTECASWFVGLFVYLLLFFERGVFTGYWGTLMVVPDSSPQAFAVVSVRNPQRLALDDGTFCPPDCCVVPWGRASAPAGVAPKPWWSACTPARFFHNMLPVCEVFVLAGLGGVSAGLGGAMRMCRHSPVFGARPGGVAVRQAPSLGPLEAIGVSSPTCLCAPSPPFRRAEG